MNRADEVRRVRHHLEAEARRLTEKHANTVARAREQRVRGDDPEADEGFARARAYWLILEGIKAVLGELRADD